jgi:hypothetical protein
MSNFTKQPNYKTNHKLEALARKLAVRMGGSLRLIIIVVIVIVIGSKNSLAA